MGRIYLTECDRCKRIIRDGEKYATLTFRIKGSRGLIGNAEMICSECIGKLK